MQGEHEPAGHGFRAKYWVFTLNNPTAEESDSLREIGASIDDTSFVTYLVFGREVAPSTGTPHLQGYMEVGARVRPARMHKLGGLSRAAFFKRRGTAEQASTYCKKSGDYDEFGSFDVDLVPGRRTDLERIRLQIVEGVPEREIAREHFATWVTHRRAFREYRSLIRDDVPDFREVVVCLLWGKAGTGKTRFVYDRYPQLFRVPSPDLQWFTGYDGQDVILIDDYRGDANESTILQLLDGYRMQVRVHYGFAPLHATKIFITSNILPDQLHNFPNEDSRAAFRRRFTAVLKFTDKLTPDQVAAQLALKPQHWS